MSEHSTVTIHGIHAVNALISKRPHDVIALYLQENNSNSRLNALVDKASSLGITCHHLSINKLEKLLEQSEDSNKKNVHQGIIATAKPKKPLSEKQLQHDCQQHDEGEPQLWIVLDNIQDPQNLGAILRNAELCACNGIIAPSHNSAPLNHTARKIASGAAELINFYQVSNLARAITHLQQANIWSIGLDGNEQDDAITTANTPQNLFHLDLTHHSAFVLGAEGSGLRQKTKQYCDQIAYLPMLGNTSSLNVSHACTVALFEAVRQRKHA